MLFRSPPWDSVVYWSIDLETGGLDPARDPILAVGMVPIRRGMIRLREAFRTLVRPEEGTLITPASVQAHQLVWRDLQEAPSLPDVLPEIARRLGEGVMLAHHVMIDLSFLRRSFKRAGIGWASPPLVDTARLLLRKARLENPNVTVDTVALNLSRARAAQGLPEYQAHDALTDAIAAAELFLALRMSVGARTLRDLRV
jgi:DNA polymerase-3 subunit epsilon